MLTYEIHAIREDGSIFAIVAAESKKSPEYEADAEAYSISDEYAKRWTQAAEVRLYRTPHTNVSSVSSFDLWPGQVHLITTIPCRLCGPPSPLAADFEDDVPF
jgi:hypothetical protein